MLKNYILSVSFFVILNTLSYGQNPVFNLDFEGTNPLSNLPSGVTNVNGTNTVLVKGTTSFPPIPNAVQTNSTTNNKELFLDFHGYLKINLSSTSQFSLAYNYRRTDNNDDWWLGFLTFIGNDGTNNKLEQVLIREWNGQLHAAGTNSSSAPIWFNTNYHIVLTVNNGDIKVFVDGVEQLNVPNSISNYNIHTWTNASLLMSFKGSSFDGTNVTPEPDFNSNCRDARTFVDNIALFNTALTQSQVNLVFQNGNNALTVENQNLPSLGKPYPNPVIDELIIPSFEIDYVEVYNLMGQIVLSKKVENSKIDIKNLSSGTYLVNGIDAKGVKTKSVKIIKL